MRFLHYAGLFLTLVVSAPLYAQTAGDDVNNSPVKQEQIQEILNNWRAHAGIPSAALSILLPGHDLPITFNSGTTVYGGRESVTADSLYQAGSITKSFTSAIILKLEAEGKLNINDPITRHLPQYPQWGNITVRELLNHTSGIFNYTEAGLFNEIRKNPREGFTPEALVRIAEQHHNYFPPGRGWKYSNTNYVLAGMIIEKVTGQAMNNVMNYYLHRGFNINLGHTYFASGLYTSSLMSRMAHGYSTAGADATYDNMSWAYTVGGIVTTPQDLLSWWRGLFEEKVLPPAQLNEMMTLVCDAYSPDCMRGQPIPHIREDGAGKGYGLGIIQSGFGSEKIGTVWWHNGTTRGYEAIVMWFPKSDIYMALMISRAPGYLLKPTLPVIRHTLSVLIPDTEWHIAHPQQPHRYFTHHKHLEKHHHQARN